MVIRLFDDQPLPASVTAALVAGEHVVCPACHGLGEVVVEHTARQDSDGVWDVDQHQCLGCDGAGVVLTEDAVEVDCCVDEHGRPLTRWRGGRCGEVHELFCDEHLTTCRGCAGVGRDDDAWAGLLTGRWSA